MRPSWLMLCLVLLLAAGCGRRDLPDYPKDANSRPASLPSRGTPVPYN